MKDLVELFEARRGQWYSRDDTQRREIVTPITLGARVRFDRRRCLHCDRVFQPDWAAQLYCASTCRDAHGIEQEARRLATYRVPTVMERLVLLLAAQRP